MRIALSERFSWTFSSKLTIFSSAAHGESLLFLLLPCLVLGSLFSEFPSFPGIKQSAGAALQFWLFFAVFSKLFRPLWHAFSAFSLEICCFVFCGVASSDGPNMLNFNIRSWQYFQIFTPKFAVYKINTENPSKNAR